MKKGLLQCLLFVFSLLSAVYADGSGDETALEQLAEFEERPINLNAAAREDLKQLPMLTTRDIDAILRSRNEKNFRRWNEFLKRELIAETVAQAIRPYVIVRAANKQETLVDRFRWYTIAYGKYPFEDKPDKDYEGDRYFWKFSGYVHYDELLEAGGTLHKDPWEKAYFDLMKGYVLLRGIWHVDSFIIGSHRMTWGEGLLMNTSLPPRKYARSPVNIRVSRDKLKGSYNNSESYLNGIALQMAFGPVTLLGFWSYYNWDATLYEDNRVYYAKTLDGESGYHRKPSEIDKKDTVLERLAGGRIKYSTSQLKAAISFIHSDFDDPLIDQVLAGDRAGILIPDISPNKFHAFRGQTLMGLGADCRYRIDHMELFLEVAESIVPDFEYTREVTPTSRAESLAFSVPSAIAGWEYNARNLKAILHARYRSRDYNAFHMSTFMEKSDDQELGLFSAVDLRTDDIDVGGYLDVFFLPNVSYYIGSASVAYEAAIYSAFDVGPDFIISPYLRYYDKPDSETDDGGIVRKHVIYPALYLIWDYRMIRNTAAVKYGHRTEHELNKDPLDDETAWAFIIENRLRLDFFDELLSVYYGAAFFKIDNGYSTALYENSLPGVFQITSINRTGANQFIMVRFGVRRLKGYVKYAGLFYDGEDTEPNQELTFGIVSRL